MDKMLPPTSDYDIRLQTVLVKVNLPGLQVKTNLCAKSLKKNTIIRKLQNVLSNILPNIYYMIFAFYAKVSATSSFCLI